ncbi:MAG: zinc ribbon domain-containing protein [Bacilli bacterium]|nr:zinc ribbon domain-containing protein [Bacilli bacterium]MDD4607756.1 zinc ribbon domain-containing protein [Bacilli bacterium]
MNCNKCGTKNNLKSKYCTQCGESLIKTNDYNGFDIKPELVTSKEVIPNKFIKYIKFILAILLKPVTTLKKDINMFDDTKKSVIFSGVIVASATIITLINNLIDAITSKTYHWMTGQYIIKPKWSNIDLMDYFKLSINNFVIYAIILLSIAMVYYLAGLIIKKEIKFSRLLGVATVSVIPVIIGSMVLMPIFNHFSILLGMIISMASTIYTIIILTESMSREFNLKDSDLKIQFNVICLTILITSGLYAFLDFLTF